MVETAVCSFPKYRWIWISVVSIRFVGRSWSKPPDRTTEKSVHAEAKAKV